MFSVKVTLKSYKKMPNHSVHFSLRNPEISREERKENENKKNNKKNVKKSKLGISKRKPFSQQKSPNTKMCKWRAWVYCVSYCCQASSRYIYITNGFRAEINQKL